MLIKILLVALPFTYIFTLNLGFPLKLSEVAAAFILLQGVSGLKNLTPIERTLLFRVALFILICAVSLALSAFDDRSYYLEFAMRSWRDLPFIGGAAKIIYLIFILLTVKEFLRTNLTLPAILRLWLTGAFISSIYGFVGLLLDHYGYYELLQPNKEAAAEMTLRTITFAEGNFASSYFVISFLLAAGLYRLAPNKWLLVSAVCSLGSILQTESTAGLFAFSFGTLCLILLTGSKRLVIALVAVGATTIPFASTQIEKHSEKLFSEEISAMSFSRYDRLASAKVAWELFLEKPTLGVGPLNYGVYLPQVVSTLDVGSSAIDVTLGRRIANNVYLEVLCETGIIGFICFMSFLLFLIRKILTSQSTVPRALLLPPLLSILVSWLAYPTFSSFYHWIFFAICFVALRQFNYPDTLRERQYHQKVNNV